MKKSTGLFLMALAALSWSGRALASDWLRNGATLTEHAAEGTPWVLKITVANATEN